MDVTVFNQEDGVNYKVTITLNRTVWADGTTNGTEDYYLLVSTDMTDPSGASLGKWVVKSLTDVPTGYGVATTWTELMEYYIDYFITQSTYGQSSSSSSSELYSSSSSSSSSEQNSSSSSSSSEQNSSSSSSSSTSNSSASSESVLNTSSSSSSSPGV